jgi:hypothetical protein
MVPQAIQEEPDQRTRSIKTLINKKTKVMKGLSHVIFAICAAVFVYIMFFAAPKANLLGVFYILAACSSAAIMLGYLVLQFIKFTTPKKEPQEMFSHGDLHAIQVQAA